MKSSEDNNNEMIEKLIEHFEMQKQELIKKYNPNEGQFLFVYYFNC